MSKNLQWLILGLHHPFPADHMTTMDGGADGQPANRFRFGELFFAKTLTLRVTPVFYVYMKQLQHWLKRRTKTKSEG
jgi:hypothetical protein